MQIKFTHIKDEAKGPRAVAAVKIEITALTKEDHAGLRHMFGASHLFMAGLAICRAYAKVGWPLQSHYESAMDAMQQLAMNVASTPMPSLESIMDEPGDPKVIAEKIEMTSDNPSPEQLKELDDACANVSLTADTTGEIQFGEYENSKKSLDDMLEGALRDIDRMPMSSERKESLKESLKKLHALVMAKKVAQQATMH